MTPTLANKLALLATMIEEQIDDARLNSTSLCDTEQELQFALDDAELQAWLVAKRRAGEVRYKRITPYRGRRHAALQR